MAHLDTDRVLGSLFIGATPPRGALLYDLDFRCLVLCAEGMFSPDAYQGLDVLRVPFEDDYSSCIPARTLEDIRHAATIVADRMDMGERVLVACPMGLNRSGLVCAFAIHEQLGLPLPEAADIVQRARMGSLTNPRFLEALGVTPYHAADSKRRSF